VLAEVHDLGASAEVPMRYLIAVLLVLVLGLAAWNYRLQKEVASIRGAPPTPKAEPSAPSVPEHHYELRSEGLRTFRFDPATGETCIKLTTKVDWKKEETKRQGCEYVDWINAIPPQQPGESQEAYYQRIAVERQMADCAFLGKCAPVRSN